MLVLVTKCYNNGVTVLGRSVYGDLISVLRVVENDKSVLTVNYLIGNSDKCLTVSDEVLVYNLVYLFLLIASVINLAGAESITT